MNGKGHVYLEYLLDSIVCQEGVDFDVIVSDQSTDDKIVELCKKYDFVECLQFDGPRNACHNTNNAMTTNNEQRKQKQQHTSTTVAD